MSDFLTRVARRALGTAPRIDPQSASRYEPSRLPLPGPALPEMATAPAPDLAPTASIDSLDSFDSRPATHHLSQPPLVTPVTEDTIATDAGHLPALKADGSPTKPRARPLQSETRAIAPGTKPLELHSESIAQSSRPLESQARSMAQGSPDADHSVHALIAERPSIDASPASMIRDDDRDAGSESRLSPIQEATGQTLEVHVSVPKETSRFRAEDEQAAAVVSHPVTDDREVESKLRVAVEPSPSATAPRASAAADASQPLVTEDHQDARGAISADFVRPAMARIDYSKYERAENTEPMIRVTIGRVEVRSAPPPAVVEPVAPPAPKLSLAEFLRQHNERRR